MGAVRQQDTNTGDSAAPRSIADIAADIRQDWTRPYFGAVPYLNAMRYLSGIGDMYGCDSAKEIVIYFLANANTWCGDVARRIKAELKALAGLRK